VGVVRCVDVALPGGQAVIPLAARRRAMLAAEHVDVSTMREAAIVGGITRCVISCGRVNGPWVSQYAADILAEFRVRNVDATPPGPMEIGMLADRFQTSYRQPFPG